MNTQLSAYQGRPEGATGFYRILNVLSAEGCDPRWPRSLVLNLRAFVSEHPVLLLLYVMNSMERLGFSYFWTNFRVKCECG